MQKIHNFVLWAIAPDGGTDPSYKEPVFEGTRNEIPGAQRRAALDGWHDFHVSYIGDRKNYYDQ